MVDTDDKAVLTWRVAEENPGVPPAALRALIQRSIPGKTLCFLDNPPRQLDTTGRAASETRAVCGRVQFTNQNEQN